MELDDTEEAALYRKAKQMLEDAASDADSTLEEIIENEKKNT